MRYRVLLVEPTWDAASRLAAALDSARFALYWAGDLAVARRGLERLEALDLLILGSALPEGPGAELCREVKESRSEVAVVLLASSAGARHDAFGPDLVIDASADASEGA